MPPSPPRAPLLVLPTYEEVTTLERVVRQALDAVPALHLLVVDDASPDGTGVLADRLAADEPRVHVLHRDAKSGLGPAYRAGFAWGLARDYDALLEMDADLSHDPADLARLVALLARADVAIGSRYVPGGGVVDWPRRRRVLSQAGNRWTHLWSRLPVADATSGYRGYRRAALEVIDLATVQSDGYAFQVELALRAWRRGLRVVELPIVFRERTEGTSKISRRIVVEAALLVARWGLQRPRRPSGVHPRSVLASRCV